MPPIDQQRADQLLALARDRFDPNLEDIEVQVLTHSCCYEDPPDWTPDPATPDPTRHETTGRPLPGAPLPTIRPTLIRWLLTDPAATALLEPRGLRVWGARLAEPLDLIGCTIPARLELRYCLVEAPIRLANASLPTLSLRNATLQQTLDAPFLKLHGPLYLDDITAAETLNFNGATITGEARLRNLTLTATGEALSMAGASITNDLILRPNLQSSGGLYLKGIHVGGFIDLAGAGLTTAETALNLDSATIDGSIYFTGKFQSAGEIRMIGAHIGGQFLCNQARLTSIGDALALDQARITGGVFFIDGFESAGAIRLLGARIGGVLNCKKAKLTTTGNALSLEGTIIDGGTFLNNGFESAGAIRLLGTRIGGPLDCEGASIQSLIGENMEVRGYFAWREIENQEQASLNLMGAKIKSIYDDHTSWPAKGNLELNALHVEDLYPLHAHHLNTDTGRIAWLNRQPDSDLAEPQPWMHLAGHLEAKGHKRAAKRVIYELRKHQSRANWKNSRFKRLGYLWDTAFGRLEQQPFFILVPILLLASLSGSIFSLSKRHFAETSESAYKATHTPNPQAASSYPKFQPFVYALENVLPVIKLGQDDKWAPDPAHTSTVLYRSLVWLRWALILSGWVMGGILAAAVSARFRN